MKNQRTVISNQAARRYMLGRQGLWPGRRLKGKEGAASAIQALGKVQVDTVSAVARNHDLVLWSRVSDYQPSHLDELMYKDRLFFDWGVTLYIYPMDDMPYYRTVMLGRRSRERWVRHVETHAEAIEFVRRELQKRGPLGNRDFEGGKRFLGAYRSEKETGQALYAMWQLGELMTHSRRGFERIYHFTDDIVGADLYGPMPPLTSQPPHVPEDEIALVERHLALKAIDTLGLTTFRARSFTPVCRKEGTAWSRVLLKSLVEEGEVARVQIEGQKEVYYMPASDLKLLDRLERGGMPGGWKPLESTTLQEANFLAPLDNLIGDRALVKALFEFDYIWEIYKPAHQRKYGPYTMPILYGDRLVGRLNPKLDRKTKVLTIDGFWLEDEALAKDKQFGVALSSGMKRFADFHEAENLDLSGIEDTSLRKGLL